MYLHPFLSPSMHLSRKNSHAKIILVSLHGIFNTKPNPFSGSTQSQNPFWQITQLATEFCCQTQTGPSEQEQEQEQNELQSPVTAVSSRCHCLPALCCWYTVQEAATGRPRWTAGTSGLCTWLWPPLQIHTSGSCCPSHGYLKGKLLVKHSCLKNFMHNTISVFIYIYIYK